MYLTIKKINFNYIKSYKKKDIIKLYYNLPYVKLIGICLKITDIKITKYIRNLSFVYIHDKNDIYILNQIENKLQSNGINCKLLRINKYNKLYLICNRYTNNHNFIINITKIKNINNKLVPIITLI